VAVGDDELIEEFRAVMRPLAEPGRVGIALGGSRAKGRADTHSDYDFRIYAESFAADDIANVPAWPGFAAAMAKWEARGIRIDGVWARKIADIDGMLDRWLRGDGTADELVWTIWGYHPLTDIASQTIIEDDDGILAKWKARLSVYPPALKRALIDKHMKFLRYWRGDYHYESRVARGDAVFLAGLAAKLVHSLFQVLFALNEIYYAGDGWNREMAARFALTPPEFGARVTVALYPGDGPDRFERQHHTLLELIDAVDALVAAQSSSR